MSGERTGATTRDWVDTEPVYARATEWLVRLHDANLTPEDILAWQAWMREDPSHTAAFQRMEEVEQVLRELPRPPLPTRQEQSRDSYDASMPIRLWKGPPRRIVTRWALAASVLIAMLGLALGGTAWIARLSTRGAAMLIATRIGENRLVRLADGSIVTLGGDSRIAVRFDPRERDIDLLHGEAFFTVAKNPHRPFKVAAGHAVVVAVGTEFNVRRYSSQVVVDVVEGRVMVLPRSQLIPIGVLRTLRPKLVPVSVGTGEETTVDSIEVAPPSRIADPEAVTAWQSGHLAFRMQPLGEVLQEVNRYSIKPIVMADSSIADIEVTGTVVSGNVSGWVTSLHSALGIVATEEPHRIVLRRQSP